MLILILAQDQENGIAKDGKIPWYIPQDLKFFKKITSGHTIIMGRNTWNSLPVRPLPKRNNLVLTSTGKLLPPTFIHLNNNTHNKYNSMNDFNVHISISIKQIVDKINLNKEKYEFYTQNEFLNNVKIHFVIGGKQIYEEFLNNHTQCVDGIIITQIEKNYKCDLKLNINWEDYFLKNNFKLLKKEENIFDNKDEKINFSYNFYFKDEKLFNLLNNFLN